VSALIAATEYADVYVIPELEKAALSYATQEREVMRAFVEDDGGILICVADSGYSFAQLLRSVFGYSAAQFTRLSTGESTTATPIPAGIAEYPAFDVTDFLMHRNAIYAMNPASLPAETVTVFANAYVAMVTVTPRGKGAIVTLAHDYYLTSRNEWADVLNAAADIFLGTHSPTPAPTPFTPAPPTPSPTIQPTPSPTPAPPTHAPTPAPPCSIRISLLMDPAIVPVTDEAGSLSNILTAGGPGYCVTEEADGSDVSTWSVSTKTAVVVPEQEVSQWTPSTADATTLREFVEVGGELVVCGDASGRSATLVKSIFGYSASLSGGVVAGAATADVLSLERFQQFRDAERTLPHAPASYGWHTDQLPPQSYSLFTAGDLSTVVVIQYGVGHIILLAHDFFTGDQHYANLLRRALFLEPGTLQPTPSPVAPAATTAQPTSSPTPVPPSLDACGSSFEVSLNGAHCFAACDAESKAIGAASCTCGASPCAPCACPDSVEVDGRIVYADDDDSNNGNIATDRGSVESEGLGAGVIAGIVIGVLVLIGCIVGGVVMSRR
jgi:hypothetical protein